MTTLKRKKRGSEIELKFWKRKVQQSKWYSQKKHKCETGQPITPKSPALTSMSSCSTTPLSQKGPAFTSPTPSPCSSLVLQCLQQKAMLQTHLLMVVSSPFPSVTDAFVREPIHLSSVILERTSEYVESKDS